MAVLLVGRSSTLMCAPRSPDAQAPAATRLRALRRAEILLPAAEAMPWLNDRSSVHDSESSRHNVCDHGSVRLCFACIEQSPIVARGGPRARCNPRRPLRSGSPATL